MSLQQGFTYSHAFATQRPALDIFPEKDVVMS